MKSHRRCCALYRTAGTTLKLRISSSLLHPIAYRHTRGEYRILQLAFPTCRYEESNPTHPAFYHFPIILNMSLFLLHDEMFAFVLRASKSDRFRNLALASKAEQRSATIESVKVGINYNIPSPKLNKKGSYISRSNANLKNLGEGSRC